MESSPDENGFYRVPPGYLWREHKYSLNNPTRPSGEKPDEVIWLGRKLDERVQVESEEISGKVDDQLE